MLSIKENYSDNSLFALVNTRRALILSLPKPLFLLNKDGVLVDLDLPGPNPPANMDPRGSTFASGFIPPWRIWTPPP